MNIAIFVSGNGTNCENIINHFKDNDNVKVSLVISNRNDAYALVRSERLGVPCKVLEKSELNDENNLMPLLAEYNIDFIVLAGFLLMIPAFLTRKYNHKILNIHPSLLPKFGGKGMYGRRVHEAVKASGDKETGITIHFVNDVYDGGDIVAQFKIPVSQHDSVEDIEKNVHLLEYDHYPCIIEEAIRNISSTDKYCI